MIRYRLNHIIKDVWRSLWYRKATNIIVLCGMIVCIATVFANVQLATSIYNAAKEKLDSVLLRRVVLTANGDSQSNAFNAAQLEAIAAMPEVESVTAMYEVQVTIQRNAESRPLIAVIESACPEDPVFSSDRFLFGRGLMDEASGQEIVLESSLANQLGIRRSGEEVTVRLERTKDGKLQSHDQMFQVVGVVQGSYRAYVATRIARSLDFWADHITRHVGEEIDDIPDHYDAAIAYIEPTCREEAVNYAHRMGLQSTLLDTLTMPRFGEECWYRVEKWTRDIDFAGHQYPTYVQRKGNSCFIGLSEDDPRWKYHGNTSDREKMARLFGADVVASEQRLQFVLPLQLATQSIDITSLSPNDKWITTSDPGVADLVRSDALAPAHWPQMEATIFFPNTSSEMELYAVENIPSEITVLPAIQVFKVDSYVTSKALYGNDDRRPKWQHKMEYVLRGQRTIVSSTLQHLGAIGAILGEIRFQEPVHLLIPHSLPQSVEEKILARGATVSSVTALKGTDGRTWVLRSHTPESVIAAPRTNVSPAVRLVSEREFTELLASRNLNRYLPKPEWHICLRHPQEWHKMKGATSLLPLSEASSRSIELHRFVSEASEKQISNEAITALKMYRPAIVDARGELSIRVNSGGATLRINGVSNSVMDLLTTDGIRLEQEFKPEVILGTADLQKLKRGSAKHVGEKLPLTVERTDAFGRNERLSIGMTIVGTSKQTCASMATVAQLIRWCHGEVEFIDGRFETPLSLETRRGATRAKLFVRTPGSIRRVVRAFETQGYLVNHKIDEMRQLESLATSLGNLTILLSSSSVLLCGFVVVGHAVMAYAVKKNEIASLQSLGVSQWDTIKALFVEGLIISAIAVFVGLGSIFLFGPVYSNVVSKAFRIPADVVHISLFAPNSMQVAGLCLLISMAYSLLGQSFAVVFALNNQRVRSSATIY